MTRSLLLVLLFCMPFSAQTIKKAKSQPVASPAVTAPTTAQPDCGSEVSLMWDLFTLNLGNTQRIPIMILVEDLGKPQLTFQMAAREALNVYADRFEIRDNAPLIFYVSGSKSDSDEEKISYHIQIYQLNSLPVSHNEKKGIYKGEFVFASGGGYVQGSLPFKSQVFKEAAYKVVGEFLTKLDK